MTEKSLKELHEELVSNGEGCTYSDKYNSIFFNDKAYKNHTVSIYEKGGVFNVSVKNKGKSFESTTPKEKKECIELKNALVERLNGYGVYHFEGVKPLQNKEQVQSKEEPVENPFGELDEFGN